ncbi:LamG-like jellyroll fold domain-containing protein [Nocardiopsis suaedae]|uniref:LamG domain-containing protein n=1 Tax=Nocardiopsis suaedae TaxID=3018444 RepID=A0ABT4TJR7_9ACTN|nr:LamG-like jellyroll fold domain-containing protein [Nocardiopsis suaedae]MDA2804926.1 LamG domain-containing protein [Nocardiopsis suaedae]
MLSGKPAGAAALGLLLTTSLLAAPASAEPSDLSPEEEQAAEQAASSGERVEIEAFTDETTQVFAEPDGSFTMESSPVPQRVRADDGWAPVDTDLVTTGDGTVRPKASAAEVAFSGGGDGAPMARVGIGSNAVELDWPEPLPEPELEGAQATYPEVLPGVDLVLTASVDGFNQVLAVKTREAAEQDALAQVEMALATQGVTMREDTAGNLSAVGDNGGEQVFTAPAPEMWDSSGSEEMSTQEQAVAPKAGARVEQVEAEVEVDRLRLTPDADMLADEATEFPVYIDPSVSVARHSWAYVNKRFPSTSYYNSSDSDTGVGYEPQYGNTKRAFWRFKVYERTKKSGTVIDSATMRFEVSHGFACTDATFELWRTRYLKSSATWNDQPEKLTKQDEVNVDIGRPQCGGEGVEFDATQAYESAAASDNQTVTYGLFGNESTSGSNWDWRRFKKDPKLVVRYNNKPSQPSTSKMSDSLGGVCSTDPENPRLINSTSPVLRAYVRDYDTKFASQKLLTRFAWWINDTGDRLGQADASYADPKPYPDGIYRSATAKDLPEGELLSYRAVVYDGQHWGAWSDPCWIEVDTSAPDTGPAVASEDYPESDEAVAGVGRPGDFTFSANGVEDAAAYHYSVNDASCSTTVELDEAGADATVTITPRDSGPNLIHARTVDAHGNSSGCVLVHTFTVAPPSNPVAHFTFDEGSGDTAADSIGDGRTAQVSGGVEWTRGRVGERHELEGAAIATDGAGGHMATDGPVVDTSGAFSVSAWVRLDDKNGNATAVSQDGSVHSSFFLGYQSTYGYDNWVLKLPPSDETGASGWTRAVSDEPARVGVWTHLLGVVDPETSEAVLYVDGVRQETTETIAQPWNGTGDLVFGRGKFEGGAAELWPGAVDDVRVWDRVVIGVRPTDAPEERSEPWLLANQVALEGRWKLDETEGTTAADSSDHGLDATLHGDPATVWPEGGDGATLNGQDERLTTDGPAIRTDRSFSVAAWVRLDETGTNSTALSQDGQAHSGFYLGHQNTYDWDQWVLKMAPSDEIGASGWSRALSEEAPELGTWTHLAATYDHTGGRMTLYLNGTEVGTDVQETPWHADGSLVIGAARFEEQLTGAWNGDIDDVHVYQGVLEEREVQAIADGFLPSPSSL